jgi:hypothetical protein
VLTRPAWPATSMKKSQSSATKRADNVSASKTVAANNTAPRRLDATSPRLSGTKSQTVDKTGSRDCLSPRSPSGLVRPRGTPAIGASEPTAGASEPSLGACEAAVTKYGSVSSLDSGIFSPSTESGTLYKPVSGAGVA